MRYSFVSITLQTTLYKPLATFYRRQKVTRRSKLLDILPIKTESRMLLFNLLATLFAQSSLLIEGKEIKKRSSKWQIKKLHDWIWNAKCLPMPRNEMRKKSLFCLPTTTFNNNLLVGFNFICSNVRSFVYYILPSFSGIWLINNYVVRIYSSCASKWTVKRNARF